MCHRGCTGATHSVHVALEPLGCTRDRVVEEGTPKQTYIQTRHVSRIKKGMIPLHWAVQHLVKTGHMLQYVNLCDGISFWTNVCYY